MPTESKGALSYLRQHPIRLHPPVCAAGKFGAAFFAKLTLVSAIGHPGLPLCRAVGEPGTDGDHSTVIADKAQLVR